MSGFQFNYLYTSILHIIMDNMVVVLLKSRNIKHFTGILTKALISHCHLNQKLNGRFFYIELVPQYLTFKISYVQFPV